MKILALDVGDRRTGLAIGNTENKLSLPLGVITEDQVDAWCNKIKEVVKNENIEVVIVGEPKTMSGGESLQTKKIKSWGEVLRQNLAVQVIFFDERLTSRQADRVLQPGTRSRDELAAMYLLQDYLDSYNLA